MKQKFKSFLVEKKELIIFIGAILFVFISVIAIASFAFKDKTIPVTNPTDVVTPTNGDDDPVVEPTKDIDNPVSVIQKFSLPVSGEYEMVRIFFDNSLTDEELAYSSLQDLTVEKGTKVKQGDILGSASTSSNDISAGVHVYLQTIVGNDYVNPTSLMGKTLEEIDITK